MHLLQLSSFFDILLELTNGGFMLSSFFRTQTRKDLLTIFSTSPLGTTPANLLDTFRTPGIQYLSGEQLKRFAWWIPQVVDATQNEEHLLTKTSLELRTVAEQHHIIIAVDTRLNYLVVGCIALWHLGRDEQNRDWFELGTLWVHPDYRYHGSRHMPIADALYRRILSENQSKNILATTTNLSAIHLGMRHGMQMIPYASLPKKTHKATCVCPFEKTGTHNNMKCPLKDQSCRVRIPFPTWQRIGKPERTIDSRITKPS